MFRVASLVVLLCLVLAPPLAAAPPLQAHRAIYDLTLKGAAGGSGIEQVHGRLVMEWGQVCDGYILNQRLLTRTLDVHGGEQVYDYSVATWESRDGLRFRFNARNTVNGSLVEETVGTAALDSVGAAGNAAFSKPEQRDVALPPGTVFPTEHTVRLIAAAEAGRSLAEVTVFDGSGLESVYHTIAGIGPPSGRPVRGSGDMDLVAGRRSWPVSLAYFPRGSKELLPEFEIGFRLFENGIAGDILLDYQDFALNGRLAALQRLPGGGGC